MSLRYSRAGRYTCRGEDEAGVSVSSMTVEGRSLSMLCSASFPSERDILAKASAEGEDTSLTEDCLERI